MSQKSDLQPGDGCAVAGPWRGRETWTSSSPPSLTCTLQWTPHMGRSQLLPHLFLTPHPLPLEKGSLVFLTSEGGSELDNSWRSSSSRMEMEGEGCIRDSSFLDQWKLDF